MARALALKDEAIPDERENVKWQIIQVSTLSIASCIGRVLIGSDFSTVNAPQSSHFSRTGVVADFAKHKGMRRVWCISIVATAFLVSQLVGLCIRDVKHLQYAVALVGTSYGMTFALFPTIAIEWFGIGTHGRFSVNQPALLNLCRRRIIAQVTPQRTMAFFVWPLS